MEFQKKILTIRHITGNIMTSIETENTSNKIPKQYPISNLACNLERE
jgi:hypothetical protein